VRTVAGALALFFASVVFVISASSYVDAATGDMLTALDEAAEVYEASPDAAALAVRAFRTRWEACRPALCELIFHSAPERLSLSLGRLEVFAQNGEKTLFLAECAVIREILNQIRSAERPTPDNIC